LSIRCWLILMPAQRINTREGKAQRGDYHDYASIKHEVIMRHNTLYSTIQWFWFICIIHHGII